MKENKGGFALDRCLQNCLLCIRKRRRPVQYGLVVLALLATLALLGRSWMPRQRRPVTPAKDCRTPISYTSSEEMQGREYRFPSVEDRIRLYMGNWYRIPCSSSSSLGRASVPGAVTLPLATKKVMTDQGSMVYILPEHALPGYPDPRMFGVDHSIAPARIFYAEVLSIQNCASDEDGKSRMKHYCRDVNETILPLLSVSSHSVMTGEGSLSRTPIFLQFGDATESRAPDSDGQTLLSQPRIPHLKKFRLAMSQTELDRIASEDKWTEEQRWQSCHLQVPATTKGVERLQPIVWKLNIRRHFANLYQVPCQDRPWEEKSNRAIFRGKLTGALGRAANETGIVRCRMLPRCQMVLEHRASKLVDARLTATSNKVPDVIDGFNLTAAVLPMMNMLSYKGLIVLEGNDVSSGLKWALLSQSVVLMPRPTFTSWAMEELLEPWIHYIPLLPDFSDVDEKVAWMIQHDTEARRISYRATLWMADLCFHPDAAKDENAIFRGILNRYAHHFSLIEL